MSFANHQNKRNSMSIESANITELEVAPDGRIYVFGASPEILEILQSIGFSDGDVHRRVELTQKIAIDQTRLHD